VTAAKESAVAVIDREPANNDGFLSMAPADGMRFVQMIALGVCAGGMAFVQDLDARRTGNASAAPQPPPANANTSAEVMDAEEVAAFLRVDRKTVYDYAGRGVIPCQRLGKRLLFSRAALVSWLTACRSQGSSNGDTR
jgi:excisionase family DNA binding protein